MDGTIIKAIRLRRGWSIREVARRTGISYSLLSKIEVGERGLTDEVRDKILITLGIATGDAHLAEATDYEALVGQGDEIVLGHPGSTWASGRIYTITSPEGRHAVVAAWVGELRAFRRLGSREVTVLNSQIHDVDGLCIEVKRAWG